MVYRVLKTVASEWTSTKTLLNYVDVTLFWLTSSYCLMHKHISQVELTSLSYQYIFK